MINAQVLASRAIDRARNLQEFTVFRPIEDIVFDGEPMPYNMTHTLGMPVELAVWALTQEEAEQQVNTWLRRQRDAV
jgi:hypothetical protein